MLILPFTDVVWLDFAWFGAVMKQKYDYKVEEQVRISANISAYYQMHQNGKMCGFVFVFVFVFLWIENRISHLLNIAES